MQPDRGAVLLRYRLVVVGASAGGLTATATVLAHLPIEFCLPIAIVQHVGPHHHSFVAQVLGRRSALPVREAKVGELLTGGEVYVAPPDFHMEVQSGRIRLTEGAPVHFVRPSADRLFESAARFGRTIAIVLSGAGFDGADGAAAVKAAGGIVIAQDEASSEYFSMPRAAIEAGVVEYVLPLDMIAPKLVELAGVAA